MTMQKFEIGQNVEWVSSNVKKVGEIIAVVPAGKRPRDVGHPKAGGGGDARNHDSYVIRGQQVWKGVIQPAKYWYWPVVSLIKPID